MFRLLVYDMYFKPQKQKQPTATISPSAKQQATEKQPIEQEATEEPEQVIADKAQELIGKPSSTTYLLFKYLC